MTMPYLMLRIGIALITFLIGVTGAMLFGAVRPAPRVEYKFERLQTLDESPPLPACRMHHTFVWQQVSPRDFPRDYPVRPDLDAPIPPPPPAAPLAPPMLKRLSPRSMAH